MGLPVRSRSGMTTIWLAATRRGRRVRRPSCCAMAPGTSTVFTRTSTASTSSRFRSPYCCPCRAGTSPAASSC
jgi:hypothetical protein